MISSPTLVTSIAPVIKRLDNDVEVGEEYQAGCISTWLKAGARVVSVNSSREIGDGLAEKFPDVEFVRSDVADGVTSGRALPSIGEMAAVGRRLGGTYGLVNSDVWFHGEAVHLKHLFDIAGDEGLLYAHRAERRSTSLTPGLQYKYGYDLFLISGGWLSETVLDQFLIGSPWWDYVLVLVAALRGVTIRSLRSPLVSHLTHEQRWDGESWRRGLAATARILCAAAKEEGVVAEVLGYLCESLRADELPAYLVADIKEGLGTVIGASVVGVVDRRVLEAISFDATLVRGEIAFSDRPSVLRNVSDQGVFPARDQVVATMDL